MCPVKSEADIDEKLTHMRPVVVLETLNLALYVASLKCSACISQSFIASLFSFYTKLSHFPQNRWLLRCWCYTTIVCTYMHMSLFCCVTYCLKFGCLS